MFFSFKSAGVIWLAVFLGNPGPKYSMTRHNAGFMTADTLEKSKGVAINKLRFQSLTARCELGGQQALLLKPQTYMNLSGQAVAKAAAYYKTPPDRILVVSDDVSLPVGKLRIRQKGSAGGHNGLKSIIQCLGTDTFPRVKIGVGAPPHPDYDMADWVLGVFRNQDAVDIQAACRQAAEAVECYIRLGPEAAMNRYN